MNVSPQRFRAPLAGTCALLVLTAVCGPARAQSSLAPRPTGSGVAASAPMGQRTAALPASPRTLRFGGMQRASLLGGASYTPPHERTMGAPVGMEMVEGTVYQDDGSMPIEDYGPSANYGMGGYRMGGFGGTCGADGCSATGGCDGSCGGTCGGSCPRCLPCPMFSLKSLNIAAGVVGFKNAGNLGSDGSFGFQEGLNWTTRLPCLDVAGINGQFGFNGVQSDLHESVLTTARRNQLFATAGLFRRVDWGLQFGAVVDYLREDWYTQMNLSQIRGEVSYVFPAAHEIGFRITESTNSQTNPAQYTLNGVFMDRFETWQALDTYRFFYRFRSQVFPGGGGSANAGFTGAGDFLLGANAVMPLGPWVALQSNFNYLLPKQNTPPYGNPGERESWNVYFGMVFFPGGANNRTLGRYDAPLFNVADNGSFLIDRLRP